MRIFRQHLWRAVGMLMIGALSACRPATAPPATTTKPASTARPLRSHSYVAAPPRPDSTPTSAATSAGSETPARDTPRVLLVAADGLEWSVLLPLVQQGRVPELQRLIEQGSFGLFETLRPTLSPRIWTTVATGKVPAKHGIRAFRYPDPDDPETRHFYTNTQRKTKAFWNILSDFDRRVHVIGWFVTFPVEPINGVMVAQTNTVRSEDPSEGNTLVKGQLVEGVPAQVWPPERQAEMMAILRQCDQDLPNLTRRLLGELPASLSPQTTYLLEACRWSIRADATYEAIARKLVAEKPPFDVLAIYLGGPDVIGHRFWRYMEPQRYQHPPSAAEVAAFRDLVPAYYVHVDRVIGELRQLTGDEMTIVVVSDHGMHPVNQDWVYGPDDRGKLLISAHHQQAPAGVLIAAGPGIQYMTMPKPLPTLGKADLPTVASVYDVAPTLLALLGLPIGRDMDGKVLDDLLEPAVLAAHPIQYVPTHDTREWLAARPQVPQELPDTQQREEQLRALGYIE
ncbi:MAG: alkaline phosphatase family protein [Planctomycetes bacterium]|nr:alkaline phosphatase family protein [Planctomycetota bacterium]